MKNTVLGVVARRQQKIEATESAGWSPTKNADFRKK
jgi:hypothetical protein